MSLYFPTWDWIAICQKCKQAFNLAEPPLGTYRELPYCRYVLTFPKGDASEVEATCPACEELQIFKNETLLRPSHIGDSEEAAKREKGRLTQLSNELDELKTEKTKLEEQLNEAYQTIKQKDIDISKFAEAYSKLVDYFILGKRNGTEPSTNPLAK